MKHISRKARARISAQVAIIVLCLAGGSALRAQDTSSSPQEKPPETVAPPNTGSYAVSVGTGELINLNVSQNAGDVQNGDPSAPGEYVDGMPVKSGGKQLRGRLFYGLSAATTYTDSVSGLTIPTGFSNTLVPFVALLEPTRTGSYFLQYSATVAPDNLYSRDTQVFHTGGAMIQGALSRRWFWTIGGTANYGSELARLEAPLSFIAVQSTPVVNSGSTAVLTHARNATFFESAARLEWLKSSRETIGFELVNAYTRIAADPALPLSTPSSVSSLGVKTDYKRTISNRFTVHAFGEADTLLRNISCQSYGGGLGLSMTMNQKVALSVEGGPQFSTPACGGSQGSNFSSVLTVNFTPKNRFYLSGSRQFSAAYQVNGIWEDNVAIGLARVMGRFALTTDAGFVHASQRSSLAEPYQGYFVTPKVTMRIRESLSCSAAYRNFHGSGGDLGSGNLSLSVLSIEWHPAGVHIK